MWKWMEMANKGNWSESALREVLLSSCNSVCLIASRWTWANLVYTSSPPNLLCMAFSTMVVLAFQKDGAEMSSARLFLTEWASQLGRSSGSKESACNAGDLGSIPGLGRFPWRRKWQPTPVFLPGKSHGWRSPAGYSPLGHKESDMTEWLHFHFLSLW